ncbi:MAG: inner membrane CreD family protein [Actinomycetota bacterium]|jgi:hypothetical protein|nr:inner membrane CreD family protein [Actinomycetota bacterium]
MTTPRLVGIGFIFALAAIAWFILGGSVDYRTNSAGSTGRDAVAGLWGTSQEQFAPTFVLDGAPLEIRSSRVNADFALDQRKKGLLWYATYAVDFDAEYGIENPIGDTARQVRMLFTFPDANGAYDGFGVEVDGEAQRISYEEGQAVTEFTLAPGASAQIRTGYSTQGLDEWRYAPTRGGVGVIDDFALNMTTDFSEIDFPSDTVSPTVKTETDGGWSLEWTYDSLVSGRPIGLVMPKPLNPGPVASRISFFAPVSLLFYFAALILTGAMRDVRIHPMNYGFLAAGFFAFHLLFAYLVDRIDINVAFVIASLTSLVLCVSYLRLLVKDRRALIELALSQFIFLVVFSYSFFFEGLTGLAVTIGSVITLGYFMAKTGHLDWEEVFNKGAEERRNRASGRLLAQQPMKMPTATATPTGTPPPPPSDELPRG